MNYGLCLPFCVYHFVFTILSYNHNHYSDIPQRFRNNKFVKNMMKGAHLKYAPEKRDDNRWVKQSMRYDSYNYQFVSVRLQNNPIILSILINELSYTVGFMEYVTYELYNIFKILYKLKYQPVIESNCMDDNEKYKLISVPKIIKLSTLLAIMYVQDEPDNWLSCQMTLRIKKILS
jgi:hypothetical protein